MISSLTPEGLLSLDKRFYFSHDSSTPYVTNVDFNVDRRSRHRVGCVTSYNSVAIGLNPNFVFFNNNYHQVRCLLNQITNMALFYFNPWLSKDAITHIKDYKSSYSWEEVYFPLIKEENIHFNQFAIIKKFKNSLIFTPSAFIVVKDYRFIVRQSDNFYCYDIELITTKPEHIKLSFDVRYLNNSFKKLSQLLYSRTFETVLDIDFESFIKDYKKENIDLITMITV